MSDMDESYVDMDASCFVGMGNVLYDSVMSCMNTSRLIGMSHVSYTEVWMSIVPYDGGMSYMNVPSLIGRIHV